ncbi:TMV resistance protein N-like [Macadamia integrifolia]|uniref:TMV resistance protein N-like n=1 Tax=Macadamia integrifolia TaxID=60698 RepID=UPI001C52B9F3|nr:TMV resistance protein N-like [Macadamia integrifolia]
MVTHTVTRSSSSSGRNYDVILNYKEEEGEETGNNFASKLYTFLEKANIKTFKDDAEISKRDHISADAVMKVIKESRCAIILFSWNYASSTRCLEELSLIMECRKKNGQRVIPVFLMGVEGSNVRRQKGSFEEPFRRHEENLKREVVERWRLDLKIAGELCGLNLKDFLDR